MIKIMLFNEQERMVEAIVSLANHKITISNPNGGSICTPAQLSPRNRRLVIRAVLGATLPALQKVANS